MTANENAKLKTLCIMRMLTEETDAEHGLSMSDIISRLAEEGISAERKGVYRDIRLLREFGMDIQTYQRNPVEYGLARRDFKLSELMLLVDAVESCRSLTSKQSQTLVGNIKSLASSSQQEQLDRTIHVAGRVRSDGDGVFGAVDDIHRALRERRQVSFVYTHIGVDGTRQPTHGGEPRVVTPVCVSYDEGFYYLTAWSDERDDVVEFRLDRMTDLHVTDLPARSNDRIARYSFDDAQAYQYFGRFNGPETTVVLGVRGDKVEIVMDRFGADAVIVPDGAGDARATVKVRASSQFFGWVAGLDGLVTIVSPRSLLDEYRAYLRRQLGEAGA